MNKNLINWYNFFTDELFDGSSNPLQYEQQINAAFLCEMDLRYFPFDIQFCEIIFQLDSVQDNFAHWNLVEGHYLGEVYIYIILYTCENVLDSLFRVENEKYTG